MSAREPKLQRNMEGVGYLIANLSSAMRTSQVNLTYPANNLGSRKERKGQLEHATYIISFESYTANTGDLVENVKESGQ
jgi:hypothetical protein